MVATSKSSTKALVCQPKVLLGLAVTLLIAAAVAVPVAVLLTRKEDEAAQEAATEAALLANLQLVQYESCQTLARSLRLYPGANSGEYLNLRERYQDGGGLGGGLVMETMAVGTAASA